MIEKISNQKNEIISLVRQQLMIAKERPQDTVQNVRANCLLLQQHLNFMQDCSALSKTICALR